MTTTHTSRLDVLEPESGYSSSADEAFFTCAEEDFTGRSPRVPVLPLIDPLTGPGSCHLHLAGRPIGKLSRQLKTLITGLVNKVNTPYTGWCQLSTHFASHVMSCVHKNARENNRE